MTFQPLILDFQSFERVAIPIVKPFHSAFRATWFHEAGRKPPRREWLVKDLILARSFGIVYGPPGCGKSFLISDLMLTCAAASVAAPGTPQSEWFRYRINPFGVVYVCAEGADDFVIRLHAWRLNQGIPPETVLPFVFLPTSIDLRSDNADTERLKDEIRAIDIEMQNRCGVGVGVVVIDTVSRALAGGNENDSAVMGAFVKNSENLQKTLEIAVLCVHHGGKQAGNGPRGHESLLGAADFVFEVMPRGEGKPHNSWAVRKFKAGQGGDEHNFVLRPMTVDNDDDGDPITSCVVVPPALTDDALPGQAAKRLYPANNSEVEFLRVLTDTIERKGFMPPTGQGALTGVGANVTLIVNSSDVREQFFERYAVTEDGDEEKVESKLRQRWKRATSSLLRNRVIGSIKLDEKQTLLWMTGKPARGVTVRGVDTGEAVAASDQETPQTAIAADDAMEGL